MRGSDWTAAASSISTCLGLDFIAAFFARLYAGVAAVPAHLPRLNRPMTRPRSIVVDAKPRARFWTSSSCAKDFRARVAGVPPLEGDRVALYR